VQREVVAGKRAGGIVYAIIFQDLHIGSSTIQSLTRFAGAPFTQGSQAFLKLRASRELPLHKGAFFEIEDFAGTPLSGEPFFEIEDFAGTPLSGKPF